MESLPSLGDAVPVLLIRLLLRVLEVASRRRVDVLERAWGRTAEELTEDRMRDVHVLHAVLHERRRHIDAGDFGHGFRLVLGLCLYTLVLV